MPRGAVAAWRYSETGGVPHGAYTGGERVRYSGDAAYCLGQLRGVALRGGGSEVYFYWVQTHSNPLTVKTYFSITFSGSRVAALSAPKGRVNTLLLCPLQAFW